MKTLPTILLLLLPVFVYGQNDAWKGKPKNLEESFLRIDQMFDDTSKYTFMTLPEAIATTRLHFGFGMWIRNNWGLWGNSELKQALQDSGFVHPDDMSSVVLKSYHRRLNHKPLPIREEAMKYREYWNRAPGDGFSSGDLHTDHDTLTSAVDLLRFFPVGDTIVVSLFATRKATFETHAASVRGIAVVKEHKDGKLVLLLIDVPKPRKYTVEYNAGEMIEQSPLSCGLIPPPGWEWK